MTGDEFKLLRERTALGVVEFGRALGYQGNDNSVSVHVRGMERGARPIQPAIARLAAMFAMHGPPSPWFRGEMAHSDLEVSGGDPVVWSIVESVGGY